MKNISFEVNYIKHKIDKNNKHNINNNTKKITRITKLQYQIIIGLYEYFGEQYIGNIKITMTYLLIFIPLYKALSCYENLNHSFRYWFKIILAKCKRKLKYQNDHK